MQHRSLIGFLKLTMALGLLMTFGQVVLAQNEVRMIGTMHQPIVRGELNGKKAFFLIDTGSSITLLNLKAAPKYDFGLARMNLEGYRLSGLNSEHKSGVLAATNAKLFLGGKRMQGAFRVIDLSYIIQSIAESTGIRIAGIIGSDLMRRHNFVIDYREREINFGKD